MIVFYLVESEKFNKELKNSLLAKVRNPLVFV